ncbi:MAG TPA: helix-hairpin-helix domain-containing protein [Dehalococcoidia bacterium]
MPRFRLRAAVLGTLVAAVPVAVGAAVLRRLRRLPPGGAPAPIAPDLAESAPATAPLDLNAATVEQLQALPGIGPARARRIVESREADGPFGSPDDLVDRGLLPASVLQQIREAVAAGP